MKITYKEYQEFWAALDAVPGHKDNWYEDDVGEWPDKPKSTDILDIKAGFLEWQGNGPQIDHPLIKGEGNWLASFRAWKKSLNHKTFVVVVNKDAEDEFRELAKQHGWKVSGG